MSIKAWQEFLANQSTDFDAGNFIDFKGNLSGNKSNSIVDAEIGNIVTDLSYLSLIEVTGNDSEDFVHAQFTTNIKKLFGQLCQFSAWCNAKGQTRATFFIYRHNDGFNILLPAELKDSFIQQLSMYILRADVRILDKSNTLIRIGLQIKDTHLLKLIIAPIDNITNNKALHCLKLPQQKDQDIHHRYILIANLDKQKGLWQKLVTHLTPVSKNIWALLDIQAGYAWITLKTSEKFLPQMLGLDRIAGLDYQKGCYPGQEIIARLHFRGQMKRCLYLAMCKSQDEPQSGHCIYMNNGQVNVGTVINAQQINDQCYLLGVVNKDAVDCKPCLQDGTELNIFRLLHH